MCDLLKPNFNKTYWKFQISCGMNVFKKLLVFILMFSKSLFLLSFAVTFTSVFVLT